jgi:hypothetical protein
VEWVTSQAPARFAQRVVPPEPLKVQARIADTATMDIFGRAHVGSRASLWAHDEPAGGMFAGTPSQVATYIAARMPSQPDTVALLTAELTHLAGCGLPSDSLSFALSKSRTVTIRPK